MTQLSTTSYAVLGLLALRDWTTYELAKQMQRTIDYVWPTGERTLYDEPKRLVEAGYARARKESVGKRPRTTYTITPAGRRALKQWLSTEAAPMTVEFEGMLRVLFADQGDLEQLRQSIHAIAEQARTGRGQFATMAKDILASGGEFPQRTHVNALGMRFMIDHYDQIITWADWALKNVQTWNDTTTPGSSWAGTARQILIDATQKAEPESFDDHSS
jgi:DNA-binding PadR family transcriptional regulator